MTEIAFRISTPQVPNFVRVEITGQDKNHPSPTMVAVCDLNEGQINSLAEDWKKALFHRKQQQLNMRESDKKA